MLNYNVIRRHHSSGVANMNNTCTTSGHCHYYPRLAGAVANKKMKKWSPTFSIYLPLIASATLMANSAFSAPIMVTSSDQICGMTLANADGYDFTLFPGDVIVCVNKSGPKLINNIIFDCNGKALYFEGDNPAQTIGLSLTKGSKSKNCNVSGFGHGFQISDSAGEEVSLTDCESKNNLYYGIFIKGDTGPVDLTNCVLEDNSQGLVLHRDVTGAVTATDCEIRGSFFHGALVRSKAQVTISGGVIEDSGRHGVLATRYGATDELSIMDIEILNNGRFGVAVTGSQPTPKVAGVIVDGNEGGAMYSRNVAPEITCANLFGTVIGEMDDASAGVCMTKGSCGDRGAVCTPHPLFPNILSLSDFCGQEITNPGVYTLDSAVMYDCSGITGVILNGAGIVLDCNGAMITGGDTSPDGIKALQGSIVTITNCDISHFVTGIETELATVTVSNTQTHDNTQYGVFAMSSNLDMTDVMSYDNGFSAMYLVNAIGNGSANLLRFKGNDSVTQDGLYIDNLGGHTGSVIITDSEFKNNKQFGLSTRTTSDIQIDGCEISDNVNYGVNWYKSSGSIKNSAIRCNGNNGILFADGDVGESMEVSCSEIARNQHSGIRSLHTNEAVQVSNSIITDSKFHNLNGATSDFILDNVYACVTTFSDVNIKSDTTVTGDFVCDSTIAPCNVPCGSVSAETFAASLVSGDCPNFGDWGDIVCSFDA